jgi:hypothetical protein
MSLIIAVTHLEVLTSSKSFTSELTDNLGPTLDDLLSGEPGPIRPPRRRQASGVGADVKFVPCYCSRHVEVLTFSKSFTSELTDNLGPTLDDLLSGEPGPIIPALPAAPAPPAVPAPPAFPAPPRRQASGLGADVKYVPYYCS